MKLFNLGRNKAAIFAEYFAKDLAKITACLLLSMNIYPSLA
ncbi:hypothetical protein [Haemophilus parahaemolyticus]